MSTIGFGGDPESFMDAPQMSNKGVAETMAGGGGTIFSTLLDLIGVHRQVAKGPKREGGKENVPVEVLNDPVAKTPQILTDVSKALSPQEVPIVPVATDAPMTPWGQRWLDSLKPLTQIDPG